MLKIDKNDEPKFFAEFKKKSNPKSWKDFDFKIKGKLKEYMLENELREKNVKDKKILVPRLINYYFSLNSCFIWVLDENNIFLEY